LPPEDPATAAAKPSVPVVEEKKVNKKVSKASYILSSLVICFFL